MNIATYWLEKTNREERREGKNAGKTSAPAQSDWGKTQGSAESDAGACRDRTESHGRKTEGRAESAGEQTEVRGGSQVEKAYLALPSLSVASYHSRSHYVSRCVDVTTYKMAQGSSIALRVDSQG